MARVTAAAPSDAGGSSLRERGAAVVHALGQVSAELHPLQQKVDAGQKLTKRQLTRFGQLTARYRELETEFRELMRPREGPETEL